MFSSYLTLASLAVAPALAQGDLAALLQSQSDLTALTRAVAAFPDLNNTLSTSSNITIFAPTDAAFEALLQAGGPEADALRNNDANLTAALLTRHVVKGQYPASAATEVPAFVHSLLTPNPLRIGTGIGAGPISNVSEGLYTGIVKNGEDVDIISNPTTVSRVTQADIRLGDSIIIHKVDNVLRFAPAGSQFAANSGLTTFNDAVEAANLTDTPVQDITVFLPTDDAFSRIGSVLASANASTLSAVLNYHGVKGVAFSPSLGNVTLETLGGGNLTVTVFPDEKIFVNGARVIFANGIVEAGAAHIIDNVLNPLAPPPARDSIDPNADAAARVQFANATSAPFSLPSATVPPQTASTPAIVATAPPYPTGEPGSSGSVPGAANPTNPTNPTTPTSPTTSGPQSTFTGAAAKPGMMGASAAALIAAAALLIAL